MDYWLSNTCMWSFCMHIPMGDHGLQSHPKDFCWVCTEFDSREISWRAHSLARNGHKSIWWTCWIVLNLGFWEWLLLLCTTDSPNSLPLSPGMQKYTHLITRGGQRSHQATQDQNLLAGRVIILHSAMILLNLSNLLSSENKNNSHVVCNAMPSPSELSFKTENKEEWNGNLLLLFLWKCRVKNLGLVINPSSYWIFV